MLTDEQRAQLKNFFAAYFHQDWNLDHANWEEVVQEYKSDTTSQEQEELRQALITYVLQFADDATLEQDMLRQGCYFDPTRGGLSAKKWVGDIAFLLQN